MKKATVAKAQDAKRRAAGYTRVSTGKQAREGLSLGEQERRVREYIEREGMECVDVFIEAGVSGRRDDRPELQRLLAELDEIEVVVIPRLDRLGRNAGHLLSLFETFERADVALVSLSESIDTATPVGRLLRSVLSAMAEFESDSIGQRVSAVMEVRARQGRYQGRRVYGYDYAERTPEGRGRGDLVILRHEAEAVRRIFGEYAAGRSMTAIARGLDSDGITPQRGAAWGRTSIAKVLDNPAYIGKIRMNEQTFAGRHEPIIEDVTWEEVQRRRAAHASTPAKGRGRPTRHLFGGELPLFCECGRRMEARAERRKGGNVYEVYRCPTRTKNSSACSMPPPRRADIDTTTLMYFERAAFDLDATRAQLAESLDRELTERRALREYAEREAHQAAARLDRVKRDYQDGRLDADDWSEQRRELAGEHRAAERQAKQHRAREAEIAALGSALDVEGETLRRLSEIRAAVIGRVGRWGVRTAGGREIELGRVQAPADDVPAVRAALAQVFEGFTLRHDPLGEIGSPEDPPIYTGDHGEFILEPRPREQMIEGIDQALKPVLKRVPIAAQKRHSDSRLWPPAAAISSARLRAR